MHETEAPRSPRGRWSRSGRGLVKASLTVAAGVCLSAGLAAAPAGASVMNSAKTSPASTAKAAPAAAIQPLTLGSCDIGNNNYYEYWSWCSGSGPTSSRSIAQCADGNFVLGPEHLDGDKNVSKASCQVDGLGSTLDTNWGILLCSNDNGAGVYQGYYDRHGDISQLLSNWGGGPTNPNSITAGGTYLCDFSATVGNYRPINPPPAA